MIEVNTDPDELLTVNEVAVILKLNRKTVLKFLENGEIRAKRFGNSWRVRRGDLFLDMSNSQEEK